MIPTTNLKLYFLLIFSYVHKFRRFLFKNPKNKFSQNMVPGTKNNGVLNSFKRKSNALPTRLTCVWHAIKMRFNALKRYAVLPVKTRINAKKLLSFKPIAFKRTTNAFKLRKTTSV